MKILIDTNIILDVLCKRDDFYKDSAMVWKLCEVKKITGVVSALSIPNIIYIMRKELDAERTKEILNSISLIFTASMKFKDYEDAVQSACASRIRAEYIITRNIRDFRESKVAAIKPAEFLERI